MIRNLAFYAGIAVVATGFVLTILAIANNIGFMPY